MKGYEIQGLPLGFKRKVILHQMLGNHCIMLPREFKPLPLGMYCEDCLDILAHLEAQAF